MSTFKRTRNYLRNADYRSEDFRHIALALVILIVVGVIGSCTGLLYNSAAYATPAQLPISATDHPKGKPTLRRIETADPRKVAAGGTKTLRYIEPFRFKGQYEADNYRPTRLYVEFSDGSAWVFLPCRYEDAPNCFWWASSRGVPGGWDFIDFRGRLIYL